MTLFIKLYTIIIMEQHCFCKELLYIPQTSFNPTAWKTRLTRRNLTPHMRCTSKLKYWNLIGQNSTPMVQEYSGMP